MSTETFEGAPGGMNLALPQQELADTEARYIQDGLIDLPGITRRRGPIRQVTGIANLTRPGTGLIMALNPQGGDKYAVLNGDNSNGYFTVLSDSLATVQADLTWPHPLPTAPGSNLPYRIVDAKPGLNGVMMIGVSSAYDANSPNQDLALWAGANRANYSAGSITVARGSAAVTAPSGFNGNVVPGMWLFANTDDPYSMALVGLVKSVNSDTSLTLSQVSPFAATAKAATFQALRGFYPKVVTGRITCDTATTTVTGGATKFVSQGLGTGTWQLYKAADGSFVGKVASVQSEISLTFASNAAVSMASDSYIALRVDADFNITNTASSVKVGWINATYAGRQWYANNGGDFLKTSRVWFSDPSDPEAVDVSAFDGDWDDITSAATVDEPIRAMAPSNTGLVVFKENETFIITGNSPATFSPKKLEDDGTLSAMTVQAYGGGVVWAGREGIHMFDGVTVRNLSNDPNNPKLGDYWKNTIRTLDLSKYRLWSMVNRDHYFLFAENVIPTVPVIKGNVSVTPNRMTFVLNMNTLAFTVATNVAIRGAITLPASTGKSSWFLVNGQVAGDSSDHAIICDGEAIFNEEGLDPVTCDKSFGFASGPDFFFESKKFDAGDSTRLKKFKQLMLHYLVQGGNINVDAVLGLNNIGNTLSGNFPASVLTWDALRTLLPTWDAVKNSFPTWDALITGEFMPRRVKFQKGSTHISFRLYQSSPSITRLKIGPYHVGYKLKRPGRVS
jgi:hypothetical protein